MSDSKAPLTWRGYPVDLLHYTRTSIAVHGLTAVAGDTVVIATSDDTTFAFGTLTAITSDTAVEITTTDGTVLSFTERARGLWVLRKQRVASWHWSIESVVPAAA